LATLGVQAKKMFVALQFFLEGLIGLALPEIGISCTIHIKLRGKKA
jgi:hypothetical protein